MKNFPRLSGNFRQGLAKTHTKGRQRSDRRTRLDLALVRRQSHNAAFRYLILRRIEGASLFLHRRREIAQRSIRIVTTLAAILLAHCVSVSLPNKDLQPASGVSLREPLSPFHRHDLASVDAAWKNSQTGALISYISECGEDHRPAILKVREDVLRVLTEREVKNDVNLTYLGAQANRSITQGRLEGNIATVELLIFNKDNCNFILSLVTTPDHYLKDAPHFENFTRGFQTP